MSDTSEIAGYVGGAGGIAAFLYTAVKWLGSRVVEREDDDKKRLLASEQTTRETLISINHSLTSLRNALDQMAIQVEKRATAQDKEIAELRAEVKDQMNQLEHRLRSDMQRMFSVDETTHASPRRRSKRP